MRHSFILLALGHRLHQLFSKGGDPSSVAEMRSKLYYHRGIVIRAVSEDLANEKIRDNDMTICSILEFLVIDVSSSSSLFSWIFSAFTLTLVGCPLCQVSYTSLDWRQHFAGVMELISVRGGPKHLFDTRPHLQMSLFLLMV